MKEKTLRKLIKEMIHQEDTWRKVDGSVVPFGCPDCIDDITGRIEDTSTLRDQIPKGTADRANLNGVLAFLRKKNRQAQKLSHNFEESI